MQNETLTFEALPSLVNRLNSKVDFLTDLLSNPKNQDADRWFDLDQVSDYIPGNPVKATLYSLVHKRAIPFHKKGKNLYFLQSEINEWLREGKRKSKADIQAEVNTYLK